MLKRGLALLLTAGGLALVVAPSASAYIYWADATDPDNGTIGRANNDGTGVDRNFITGVKRPCGVAVDAQHIYWGNRATNSIGRANLDGSNVDIAFVINSSNTVGPPCGVAVDDSSIWWANLTGGGGQGSIGRANLDGTGVQSLLFNSPTFAKDPISVALSGNLVFWSNLDTTNNFAASSIGRAGKDGTPPPSASFIPMGSPLAPFWLAADDTHLYFAFTLSTVPVEIFRANLDGTDADAVVEGFPGGGLAVDAGKLYWANSAEQTISRANTDGTDPEFAYITNVGQPLGLAVDGGVPSNEFAVGAVSRDKRHGTAIVELAAGDPGTYSVAGTGVKPVSVVADGVNAVTVSIAAAGKAKNHLKRDGKVRLTADVTFTAIGNATPSTQQVPVKLVRKR